MQQGHCGHDLSRRAEATLWAEFIDECLLDGVKLAGFARDTLNRANVPIANTMRQSRTRVDRVVVDQHCARATLSSVTSKFGTRKAKLVAQCHGKSFLRQHIHASYLTIHVK